MEEAALTVTRLLVRLIFPIGVIAICVGVLTVTVTAFRREKGEIAGSAPRFRSSVTERIVMGLLAAIAAIGLVVAVQTLRLSPPPYWSLSVIFVVATVLLGLPAVFWKTRWRQAAEGVATVALAIAAILAGFSIGFAFVPLLVLMIWICIKHLRETENAISRRPV